MTWVADLPAVRATAPAKLNLGLAILGRRPDGFHELRSVFQTVTICDRLALHGRPGTQPRSTVTLSHLSSIGDGIEIDDPGLVEGENLAVRALRSALQRTRARGSFTLSLEKGIPAASGMGGASADAAATILMAEMLTGIALDDDDRLALAADLGSDVPFFLTGGTALVSGRGECIEPLPPVGQTTFVAVFPRLTTPMIRKTARLFGALRPEDVGDGEAVRRQARRVRAGKPIDTTLLGNGFSRPLLELAPELNQIHEAILTITGQTPALSGAGPTHYVVEPDAERAAWQAAELRRRFGSRALVVLCEPWDGPPRVEATG